MNLPGTHGQRWPVVWVASDQTACHGFTPMIGERLRETVF